MEAVETALAHQEKSLRELAWPIRERDREFLLPIMLAPASGLPLTAAHC